jgi:formate/nitrite transporter FocA (FNT family)
MSTWQLALVIWLITGVTVAGAGVLAVLAVPQLNSDAMRLIPLVSAAGFAIAFIVALAIAGRLKRRLRAA